MSETAKVIRLDSVRADLERERDGDWIDYPDWPGVQFHVSALTGEAYTTARDLLLQRLAKKYRGKPPPASEVAVEMGRLYAKHILHGWKGFDVAYSLEVAEERLCDPAYRALVAAVEWCAGQMSETEVAFVETQAKNSRRPSGAG